MHEIKHTYYMVSGMGRARDLTRVLDVEKPDSAIIFCNTREDTALVADFLRKTGMDAEAISSDLTQKDRERVMNRMKAKDLKFLVATDIAARGIDISDLSHVINYTFPESAEVYVHRTGRTGRAGKSGVAISLISPRELGNFYMLKLTYKIKPEERTLPSDEHVKTQKEAQRVDELRAKIGTREAADGYRQLAKRVWAADDGERMVALLIEEKLTPRIETRNAPERSPMRPSGRWRDVRRRRARRDPSSSRRRRRDRRADSARRRRRSEKVSSPAAAPSANATSANATSGNATSGNATSGNAATAGEDDKEGGPERQRRRRGRRGGRGGERERREPDTAARGTDCRRPTVSVRSSAWRRPSTRPTARSSGRRGSTRSPSRPKAPPGFHRRRGTGRGAQRASRAQRP